MSNLPISSASKHETSGATGGDGVTITASGSTNTKGSYAQITAATGFKYEGLYFYVRLFSTEDYLFDLAIGGAGSEKIIVSDLYISSRTNAVTTVLGTCCIFIPVKVPAGARLAVRCQSTAASATARVIITGAGSSPKISAGFSKAIGIATSASSRGVTVDPGGTAVTKGSYAQLIASTTVRAAALLITTGAAGDNVKGTNGFTLDIAIGAAASEKIIIPDMFLACSSAVNIVMPRSFPIYNVDIPAGTRLAARAAPLSADATAASRRFDLGVLLLAA